MMIDPKLLEVIKIIKDVGGRDMQATVDELQVNRPDLFESLVAAHGNGEYVEGLFNLALDGVLGRNDLDGATKDKVRAGAADFQSLLESFRETPQLSHMRWAIFEFAGIALLTGLQAGLSPAEFDRFRSRLSEGGKNSAAGREARWPWKPRAEELAKEACKRDPNLSPGKIASAIEVNWKLTNPKCPGHRTLEEFVKTLRRERRLPQRERPKRGASIRN